jgi:DNA-binding transcriptional regulator YiaG
MTNIASVLKAEISRVARKEVRAELQTLKKSSAAHRRDIAALKRRLETLERQAKRQKKVAPRSVSDDSDEESGRQLRFSPTRLAAQRKKLGFSAAKFASLIGVSPISVYNWESGKARPQRPQLEAIAAARKLGKREALARLEELQQA